MLTTKVLSSPQISNEDKGVIDILIASFNEGIHLIDAIKSIANQDYKGLINIHILIGNESDSSYKSLIQFQKKNQLQNRKLLIHLTGINPKKDKINSILPKLTGKYVAFLDADHRADLKWISSSLSILSKKNAKIIQSVRKPLALKSFFQIWDSLQNHIGNEVLNHLYYRFNLTSFFTGTTCLFERDIFKKYKFEDSLTEDTALSYKLILQGEKIEYNPYHGSFEDVSPQMATYIARRRRWSHGHNQTFLKHFSNILTSNLAFKTKIQLLLHGSFYLLPLLILISSQIMGWYFFAQYTQNIQYLSIGLSFLVSLSFCMWCYKNLKELILEIFISFLVFFPYVSTLSILFYKFYQQEHYYYVLSFPFHKYLYWVITFMLLAPLSSLIAGRKLSPHPNALVFFSHLIFYPIVLISDIFASSLGLLDLTFKRKSWGNIKRGLDIDASIVPEDLISTINKKNTKVKKFYLISLVPIISLFSIVANDLLVFHNCGRPSYLFNDYFLYEKKVPLESSFTYTKTSVDQDHFILKLNHHIINPKNLKGDLKIKVDKDVLYHGEIKNGLGIYEQKIPMSYDTKNIDIELKTNQFSCYQKKSFATSVKEIKNNNFYVNGEPFLIKCLIPSFTKTQNNLNLNQGLEQLKKSGANCIRIYHSPSKDLLNAAKFHQMMIISQPDETTWENIDIYQNHNIKKLVKKYREHIKLTQGHPFILFDHLGNELELNRRTIESIANLEKAMQMTKDKDYYRFPLSYATYLSYKKYPVDLLGINMLDSGLTYWQKALNHTKSLNIPFYASEFGGFVAYYENTPTFVRIHRLYDNWKTLTKLGALGAAFFQSHDNWAQPVPFGYNDPFKAELPDDRRGFWDKQNNAKKELYALKTIFSDFFLKSSQNKFEITNRRKFMIKNLKINIDEKEYKYKNLNPGQKITLNKNIEKITLIKFNYSTHKGLKQFFEINYNPKYSMHIDSLKQIPLKVISQRVINGFTKIAIELPQSVSDKDSLLVEGVGSSNVFVTNPQNNKRTRWNTHNYREQIMPLKNIFKQIGKTRLLTLEFKRDLIQYLKESDGKKIMIDLQRPKLVRDLL